MNHILPYVSISLSAGRRTGGRILEHPRRKTFQNSGTFDQIVMYGT